MSSAKDKRRTNRIQGAWNPKSNTSKCKISFESEPQSNNGNIIPEFDNTVVGEEKENMSVIEVYQDIDIDLNKDSLLYLKENFSIEHYETLLSETIPAQIELKKDFIPSEEASELCEYFLKNLPWEQRENATPSGEIFLEPRKTCWYGLPYSYSKIKLPPNENWDPKLKELMERIQKYNGGKLFNSVMCNLYLDNKNSIDWHADDEKSLGVNPIIASISLGCSRPFEICYRSDLYVNYRNKEKNPFRSRSKDEPPFDGCSILYRVFLDSGSLLIMSGTLQKHWLHRVPKEYHDMTPRINFTFRHIISDN